MNVVGTVEQTAAMDDEYWQTLLANHPEIEAAESISVVNPFTQELTELTHGKAFAKVLADGAVVGSLRWCTNDGGIELSGEPDVMTPLGKQIAEEVGGTFASLVE